MAASPLDGRSLPVYVVLVIAGIAPIVLPLLAARSGGASAPPGPSAGRSSPHICQYVRTYTREPVRASATAPG